MTARLPATRSARHPRSGRGGAAAGFTLIELIVVIFLITLLIGVATLTLSTHGPKKKLMEPAVKMKVFAQKALSLSRNTRRPHSIYMNSNFFVLRETHMREEDVNAALDPRLQQQLRDELEDEGRAPEVRVVERYDLDEGTEIHIRHLFDKDWRVPKDEDWNFYTSGMCDPIMIRFSTEDGFIAMEFNPLTAKLQVDGQTLEIYPQKRK